MTETTAGWSVGDGLPPGVRRRLAESDLREALESMRAAAEREQLAEDRRQRALGLARQEAEARGEDIDPLAFARGELRGRPVSDILAAARSAAEREDVVAAARASREPGELAHVFVGEPVIHHAARSERGLKMWNRHRRFTEARRAAAAAEEAAEASRGDLGLIAAYDDRVGLGSWDRPSASRHQAVTTSRGDYLYDKDYGVIRPVSYR